MAGDRMIIYTIAKLGLAMAISLGGGAVAVSEPLHSGASSKVENMPVDEKSRQEIRELLYARVAAMRDADAEGIAASLHPSAMVFEMVPPLRLPPGAANDVSSIRAWLAGWEGAVTVEIRDLQVEASGDVGFAHSLNRLSGTMKGGRRVDIWMRSTIGVRRFDGRWKIVHAHTSVPFHPGPSAKAALDLHP